MKHKLSAVIAIALLAVAVAIGITAVTSRSDHHGSRAGATSSAIPSPSATGTAASGQQTDPSDVVVVPKGIVNPLKAHTYCATAKLLAVYTKQGYGLDAQLGIVNGRKFDERLKTIAATFSRLAEQAPGQPRAGDVARHWKRLAEATTKAEEQLRVVGLQTQSQAMIAELGRWNQLSAVELPKATVTLKAACGFSSAIFGT